MVPSEVTFGDEPDLTEWALPNVRRQRFASLSDCCLEIVIPGIPELVLKGDDLDPFTGEAVGDTVVYWSNGTITRSYGVDEVDADGEYLGRFEL